MSHFTPTDDVAAIRERIGHPIVDTDGHLVEVMPVVFDLMREHVGADVARRAESFNRLSVNNGARGFHGLPAENTLDRMTVYLPKLLYARLDEIGIDFALLYPTAGLSVLSNPDDELRRAFARALNIYYSQTYADYRDRLEPVAVIPMFTPDEAIDELRHVVRDLGLKAVVMGGVIPRRGRDGDPDRPWIDNLGHGSAHDYDPVWAECVELGVTPAFHSVGYGWGSRLSTTNYVFNHLGNFAAAQEAVCRSLVMGGVPVRFPELAFTFLEGGAAWAAQLVCDLVGHYEKRNHEVVGRYSDARIDVELADRLHAEFGEGAIAALGERFRAGIRRSVETAREYDRTNDLDDFRESGITSVDQIVEIFRRQFFFGCEADDPMNALAFDTRVLPRGSTLRAMFASDIGHWDVSDVGGVLPEAWELVEHGLLDLDQFREFTCTNALRAFTTTNPSFFEGTAVEGTAKESTALAER